MQIYLTSHHAEADLIALIHETLAKQQLQDEFTVEVLPTQQTDIERSINPSRVMAVTVLVSALGAGGAITVGMSDDGAITHLAKALELFVDRKVEVTIKRKNETIEISGSAGHIEDILKESLKKK